MTSPLDEVFQPYPAVLTVEQVAELVGKQPGTVYRLLQRQQLPGYKVGGEWTIYKAELLAWLRSQRTGPEIHPSE